MNTIYEFEINEKIVDDNERQQRDVQLAETFPVELREKLLSILNENEKSVFSYSISKNGEYVGEITFSNENPQQPEIGIELEEPFQRQGIGYRLTSALIERYKKEHKVDYFVYRATSTNIGSNALAKKLGGKPVKEVVILKELNFSMNTYHIM
ncbi:MAG: GNAT family N-acetyltransferase [Clostridia bacterium]|nr:GNAT family N-acetyltransferase [Clostridia bacterium]